MMKLSELHKTDKTRSDDSDDDSGSDEEEEDEDVNTDDDPVLEHVSVNHRGGVNRIRSMPQRAGVVATWADTGHVHVLDLQAQLRFLDNPAGQLAVSPPRAILTSALVVCYDCASLIARTRELGGAEAHSGAMIIPLSNPHSRRRQAARSTHPQIRNRRRGSPCPSLCIMPQWARQPRAPSPCSVSVGMGTRVSLSTGQRSRPVAWPAVMAGV
jgi:hypothetical protein